MPIYKYVANRFLTMFENLVVQYKLSEYHTGLRAFSKALLHAFNLESNSDDFVFDNQIIVQALAAGARIGELSCPTRYHADASSINFRRSLRYGFACFDVLPVPLEHVRSPQLPLLEVNSPCRPSAPTSPTATAPSRAARRDGDPPAPTPAQSLDQVVPAEELGDRGVLEHRVDGVGDDLGHREHLELVEGAVLGHGQRVGHHHP